MDIEELYEYMSDPVVCERVCLGFDIAAMHLGFEEVYAECIRCGYSKDVDAMKLIINNGISLNRFVKIKGLNSRAGGSPLHGDFGELNSHTVHHITFFRRKHVSSRIINNCNANTILLS